MTLTLQLFPYVPLVQCKESGFLSITESTWKSIKKNCYMWSVTLNSGCFTHMQQLSWKELFSLKKIEIIKIMFSREKFGITVTFKGHYNKNCFWIKNHCCIQLKTLKTKTAFIVWPWRLLPCWMLVIYKVVYKKTIDHDWKETSKKSGSDQNGSEKQYSQIDSSHYRGK